MCRPPVSKAMQPVGSRAWLRCGCSPPLSFFTSVSAPRAPSPWCQGRTCVPHKPRPWAGAFLMQYTVLCAFTPGAGPGPIRDRCNCLSLSYVVARRFTLHASASVGAWKSCGGGSGRVRACALSRMSETAWSVRDRWRRRQHSTPQHGPSMPRNIHKHRKQALVCRCRFKGHVTRMSPTRAPSHPQSLLYMPQHSSLLSMCVLRGSSACASKHRPSVVLPAASTYLVTRSPSLGRAFVHLWRAFALTS